MLHEYLHDNQERIIKIYQNKIKYAFKKIIKKTIKMGINFIQKLVTPLTTFCSLDFFKIKDFL